MKFSRGCKIIDFSSNINMSVEVAGFWEPYLLSISLKTLMHQLYLLTFNVKSDQVLPSTTICDQIQLFLLFELIDNAFSRIIMQTVSYWSYFRLRCLLCGNSAPIESFDSCAIMLCSSVDLTIDTHIMEINSIFKWHVISYGTW